MAKTIKCSTYIKRCGGKDFYCCCGCGKELGVYDNTDHTIEDCLNNLRNTIEYLTYDVKDLMKKVEDLENK